MELVIAREEQYYASRIVERGGADRFVLGSDYSLPAGLAESRARDQGART